MLTVSEVAYVVSADLGAKMIGIPYKVSNYEFSKTPYSTTFH